MKKLFGIFLSIVIILSNLTITANAIPNEQLQSKEISQYTVNELESIFLIFVKKIVFL